MFWAQLIDTALDWLGTDDANKKNAKEAQKDRDFQAKEADDAMEFSSAEALANREFQKEMASTQHSRSAADLKNAGLNRILALGQPAAAASGAQASSHMGSGSRASAHAPNSVSTGIQGATARQQIALSQSQQELLEAQADNVKADTLGKLSVNEAKEMMSHIPSIVNDLLGEGSDSALNVRRISEKIGEAINQYTDPSIKRSWWQKNALELGEETAESLKRSYQQLIDFKPKRKGEK